MRQSRGNSGHRPPADGTEGTSSAAAQTSLHRRTRQHGVNRDSSAGRSDPGTTARRACFTGAFPHVTPQALLRPQRQTGFALPASSRSPAGSRETEAARRRERFREVSASRAASLGLWERGLGSRALAGSPWTATCCGSRWAATARRCCRCCGVSSKTTRTSGAFWARRPSQPAARRRLREPAGMGVVTRAWPGRGADWRAGAPGCVTGHWLLAQWPACSFRTAARAFKAPVSE